MIVLPPKKNTSPIPINDSTPKKRLSLTVNNILHFKK